MDLSPPAYGSGALVRRAVTPACPPKLPAFHPGETPVLPRHLKRDALDPGAWNDEGVGGNGAAIETEDPGYARERLQLGNDTCLI